MIVPLIEIAGGTGYLPDNGTPDIARQSSRILSFYAGSSGLSLLSELDALSARALEPNIFFNPRFLAPAMSRLGNNAVQFAVIRDHSDKISRLRLLMPFTINRLPLPLTVPVMRIWSTPFSPLGTPLVDHDDPAAYVEFFFNILAQPELNLPKVIVLPDIKTDGSFAAVLRSVAEARNLPLQVMDEMARPYLKNDLDGETYLRGTLRAHHFREFRRLKRRLQQQGELEYTIGRQSEEINAGIEAFLELEARGWKGRRKTAMGVNHQQAAFARETAQLLGEADQCRIHMLQLDGRPIAILIVLVASGVAYTWKTAFDEAYAAFSPGTLLMIETTKNHLEDPTILETDSCATPDHVVMSRLWGERCSLATYVIGLSTGSDKLVNRAVKQFTLSQEVRSKARLLRNRIRSLLRKI